MVDKVYLARGQNPLLRELLESNLSRLLLKEILKLLRLARLHPC